MYEPKHTPGPWVENGLMVGPLVEGKIAKVAALMATNGTPFSERPWEDAALLADAPALLAGLIQIAARPDPSGDVDPQDLIDELQRIIDDARALIAPHVD